tara:strand:+ start:370 stop:816 length:447 start_codon:yes stop_codon:yes gene_type:complete
MLLKKIHRLKITTKNIQNKIVQLNNKINKIEELECLLKKTNDLNRYSLNKIEELEEKVSLLEKEIKDTKESCANYKEVCSKDITVLASAITELYNLMNVAFEGKLLKKSDYSVYKEKYFDNSDFFEDTEDFLFEEDPVDKNKKKKIYH